MYPNLYYAFNDLFGVDLSFLKLVNSFGFFVAMAFVVAGVFIKKELIRLTADGVLKPNQIKQLVGAPASAVDIISQAAIGFLFGWKFLYLAFNASTLFDGSTLPQSHLFSTDGSVLLGLLSAALLAGWSWWEGNKQKLDQPELRTINVKPYEHVGSMLTVAAVGGILGAKLFHLIEYPEQFVAFFKAPSLNAFLGGLTIYGGLIMGGISVWLYTRKYNYNFLSIADITSPALMIGYGVGRIGCQVSGDGDWGINNTLSQPNWLSWLPDWTWSYQFPNNVNGVGRLIADTDPWAIYPGYGTCLDVGVFPTSLYETTLAIILFGILWSLRKRFKTAGLLFATYLMLNGFERFWIEKIRVNTSFELIGITMTQAELISVILMVIGASLFYFLKKKELSQN
jgi:phosphatidylglycerol:prolipoprotein diacylglycerol transferase